MAHAWPGLTEHPMSFILDALRKSENDRREQTQPGLATTPRAAPKKKSTVWLPILVVVLTLNALVFGTIVLTRDEPAPTATELPTPEVRSLRKESVVDTAPTIQPKVSAPTPEKLSATPAPTTPSVPAKSVAASDPPVAPSRSIQEGLPSLGQLRAAGLVSVADLRIDMHVYSSDAAKRFVFVNMKKYREGDRLIEGPTIEEITPSGVIMVQQGNRFTLDRD